MGCDIHSRCEVFKNGKWHIVGNEFEDPYAKYHPEKDGKTDTPYGMRNYSLFAFLADVRNDSITPLDSPRGVPNDASKAYQKYVNQWGVDGHSHSYFTLAELLAADYDVTVQESGMVGPDQYKAVKEQGHPTQWSGGVGGGDVFIISNEQMEEYLQDPDLFQAKELGILLADRHEAWTQGDNKWMKDSPAYQGLLDKIKEYEEKGTTNAIFYTEAHWTRTLRECIGSWWFEKTLPRLKELAPDGDFARIRMVFFFDN